MAKGFLCAPLISQLPMKILNTHQCTKWEKLVSSFVHGSKQPCLIGPRIIIFGPIYLPFPCVTLVARALSHHRFNSYIVHVLAIGDNIAVAKENKQFLFPLSYTFIFQIFLSFLKKKKNKNKLLLPIYLFFLFFLKFGLGEKKAIKEERKSSLF